MSWRARRSDAAASAKAWSSPYNESEQMIGFHAMLDDHLDVPFKTEVLGVEVTVEKVGLTDDDQIVVICTRGRSRASCTSLIWNAIPRPPGFMHGPPRSRGPLISGGSSPCCINRRSRRQRLRYEHRSRQSKT
jgi:hypothetical protein